MDNTNTSLTILEILSKIQLELNIPKGQWNDFANFHYRSLDDVQPAVNRVAAKYGATTYVDHDVILIGDRFYIVANLYLVKWSDGSSIHVKAFAREGEPKAKMDVAQCTGASTSYAAKYAYNNMFGLDNPKDPDSYTREEYQGDQTKPKTKPKQRAPSISAPIDMASAGQAVSEFIADAKRPMKADELVAQNPPANFNAWLKGMRERKQFLHGLVGDDNLYYETLNSLGYKKSNEIKRIEARETVWKLLNSLITTPERKEFL